MSKFVNGIRNLQIYSIFCALTMSFQTLDIANQSLLKLYALALADFARDFQFQLSSNRLDGS